MKVHVVFILEEFYIAVKADYALVVQHGAKGVWDSHLDEVDPMEWEDVTETWTLPEHIGGKILGAVPEACDDGEMYAVNSFLFGLVRTFGEKIK